MSRRMKLLAAVLGLIIILTGVFTSVALAEDATDNQNLPACCQQQQGLSSAPSCCGQQGNAVTDLYQGGGSGSCCGR
ncbi:hypothetical protein ACFLXL_00595 [Chloroflexota bacterium]